MRLEGRVSWERPPILAVSLGMCFFRSSTVATLASFAAG